ncbi:MAG: hypothetical protein IJ793_02855 [Opitutales bacterium]|nr:hypothetical protein [Opitutales bacterium]
MLNEINTGNSIGTVSQPGNADTSNINLNESPLVKEKQLELSKTKTNAALNNTTQTIPVRKTLSNNQPTFSRFAKSSMSMGQALDTLLFLKERMNKEGVGTFAIGSFALEKIKNIFWKFVGFFKKSFAEEHTKQLNAKIDDPLQNFDKKSNEGIHK